MALPPTRRDGEVIRADEWNAMIEEIDLRASKTGDAITGDLTVSGKLGVGVGQPGAPLHVRSSSAQNLVKIEAADGEHHAGVHFSNDKGSKNKIFTDGATGNLKIQTENSDRLVIDKTGKVGIGTTTLDDAATLTVEGVIKPSEGIKFSDDTILTTASVGGGSPWNRTGDNLHYTNGNVGIGTDAPFGIGSGRVTLHVAGSTTPAYVLEQTQKEPDQPGRKWAIYTQPNSGNLIIGDETPDIPQVRMKIDANGNVAIGGVEPLNEAKLHVNGNIHISNGTLTQGSTQSTQTQFMNGSGRSLEKGEVVVIKNSGSISALDPENDSPIPEIGLANKPYDNRVCGVVSRLYTPLKPSFIDAYESRGMQAANPKSVKKTSLSAKESPTRQQAFTEDELVSLDVSRIEPDRMGLMVTHGVFARCKVDADIASIKIGDLLTTSSTDGHAQKVIETQRAMGSIIGKALAPLKKGKGVIPILIMLR